jgi:DUF4097 and DUF4098 domain-containing protein YvlB
VYTKGVTVIMKKRLWLLSHLVAVILLTCCISIMEGVTAEGSFDRTLEVSRAVNLDIRTGSGGIRVSHGDTSQVRIHGSIRVRRSSHSEAEDIVRELEQNPPVEQNGNEIRIGHQNRDDDLRRNVSISYELIVPANTELRARTGSGSIAVEGLQQPVEARTGSGSVDVRDVSSRVEAHTGSGSITLTSIQGETEAHTGSGRIRAEGLAGPFTGSTGSGSISIEQTAAGGADIHTGSGGIKAFGVEGPLKARTGSGSIRAEGKPIADWDLHTGSGSISLRLPPDAAFNFEGRSSSGGISIDHPVTVQGRVERRRIQGQVRGGGPLVRVETGSGSVEVE